MRATGAYDGADTTGAAGAVAGVLQQWGLKPGGSRLWLQVAGAHCGPVIGEWVVEYDRDLQLVTFEVWADQSRLFGIDDLV